jgi:Ser/Thr protein kinase RdoA (MazF antagonist)
VTPAEPPTETDVAALEALARRALDSYDLDVAGVELITNEWNAVFQVELRDGSRRVVRVGLAGKRTPAEVEGEMRWLEALARETDVTVPEPVPARDGALVVRASADGVPEPRACSVFRWIQGEMLADHLTEPNLEAAGSLTARLHAHAVSFPIPSGMRTWDSPYPFDDPVVLFDEPYRSSLAGDDLAFLEDAVAETGIAIVRLMATEPPRMIHADLHEENLFVDGARVSVLDFDDCTVGWPVQDLGVTWFNLANHDAFDTLAAAFRRGYETVAPWPEREPGEIAVFAGDRALHLANYVVQDHDPQYRAEADEWVARFVRRGARCRELDGRRG